MVEDKKPLILPCITGVERMALTVGLLLASLLNIIETKRLTSDEYTFDIGGY